MNVMSATASRTATRPHQAHDDRATLLALLDAARTEGFRAGALWMRGEAVDALRRWAKRHMKAAQGISSGEQKARTTMTAAVYDSAADYVAAISPDDTENKG